MSNSKFIVLLKEYTTIDEEFLDTFFEKYEIGGDLDFHIKDSDVALYLGIQLKTLRQRLNNNFTKKEYYKENADYIKIKTGKTSGIIYMLNYKCFEHLAMTGDSEQSSVIRDYFIKLREFLVENQNLIYQSMKNNEILRQYSNIETIYFFAVDERKNFFKVGRTNDIITRLRTYNTGRIKDVELKYFAAVKNSFLIEKCIKSDLKDKRVIKYREIYEIEPSKLKKIVDECYCKHVNRIKNEELYEELSELLGMYGYLKNKKYIKPYVIIGKNL